MGGAREEWAWLASVVVKAQTDREGGNGPKENVDFNHHWLFVQDYSQLNKAFIYFACMATSHTYYCLMFAVEKGKARERRASRGYIYTQSERGIHEQQCEAAVITQYILAIKN